MKYTHVIWDWNGTLLDDVTWCMFCINTMLSKRSLTTLDSIPAYHSVFGFPVIDYYRRVGLDFEKEPFEVLAKEYMTLYHDSSNTMKLFSDTIYVLTKIKEAGIHQTILSATESYTLSSQISYYGISSFFEELLGTSDIYAFGKTEIGKEYIKRVNPEKAVLIGDTIHDKEVADLLSIDCILVSHGHQSRETLSSSGAMVVGVLEEVLPLLL